MATERDTIKDMLEEFSACEEAEKEQRDRMLSDLMFARMGEQWDENAKTARGPNRPTLTFNLLNPFIRQVTNDARLNRASIGVVPVGGGADKETANIQSDLIRNIEVQSQAPIVYDTATEFAVAAGKGYFRVDVDYACEDAWDLDILLRRVSNPFSIYGDPDSTEATSIDWNRAFVTDWFTKAEFKRRWPEAKATGFETGGADYSPSWFKDKKIQVAEWWRRWKVDATVIKLSDGRVMWESQLLRPQKINGIEVTMLDLLQQNGITVEGRRVTKSYKVEKKLVTGCDELETEPWLGKYIPIIPMYGEEINVNGKRLFLSLHRDAHDAQRMYNYLRTTGTELIGLSPKAPYIGPKGAFNTDADKWQTVNTQAHPYVQYDGTVPPARQQMDASAAGIMREAMIAHDDVKATLGMFDASLGARSNETSGRAIMARQREGDTSTFHFIDNRDRAVEHGGRVILDLLPYYYNVERILRCVQEDGESYMVPVNQPVAPRDQLAALQNPQQPMPMPGPMQMPEGVPPMGVMPGMPERADGPPQWVPVPEDLSQRLTPEGQFKLKAITKVFDLTVGKYDVVVARGPSFTSRREEAATQMMEFIRVFPQAAGLVGDLLAKNLDWPGAEQISERLKIMLPPEARGQIAGVVQNLQKMLQTQDAQAKQAIGVLQGQIAELRKELAQKDEQLNQKAAENELKGYEATTKRMSELVDAAKAGVTVISRPDGGLEVMPGMPPMPAAATDAFPGGPVPGMQMPPGAPPMGGPGAMEDPASAGFFAPGGMPGQMPPQGGVPPMGGGPGQPGPM